MIRGFVIPSIYCHWGHATGSMSDVQNALHLLSVNPGMLERQAQACILIGVGTSAVLIWL